MQGNAGGDGFDVIVVGAGIVGLSTALLVAEGGLRVAVVTAEPVGGGSTGRSAGIVSQLHGAAYTRMRGETARRNAIAYRRMNADGFAWLESAVDRLGVPHERRDALLVAGSAEGTRRIDDEHLAARRAGLPLEKVRGLDLPFPAHGALRLPAQLLVDPRALLVRLAVAAQDAGAVVVEQERVVDVRVGLGGTEVETAAAVRRAPQVVLATGTPILDRGLYLLKTQAYRILAVGGTGADLALPLVTSIGPAGSRTVSVGSDGRTIVSGAAHPTGVGGPESRRRAELERWAAGALPGFTARDVWSGQDYRPYNPIAFVGALPGGLGRVRFATGFDGWGMTQGAAAGLRLAADLLGRSRPAWATTIGRRITRPRSQGIGLAGDAAAVARRVASVAAVAPADRRMLADGAGIVHRAGERIVATSRVDGLVLSVSGRCPRFGGALVWNDLELSWDCQVCGSRYAPDGSVLEGGTRTPLHPEPVDPTDWGGAPSASAASRR